MQKMDISYEFRFKLCLVASMRPPLDIANRFLPYRHPPPMSSKNTTMWVIIAAVVVVAIVAAVLMTRSSGPSTIST